MAVFRISAFTILEAKKQGEGGRIANIVTSQTPPKMAFSGRMQEFAQLPNTQVVFFMLL